MEGAAAAHLVNTTSDSRLACTDARQLVSQPVPEACATFNEMKSEGSRQLATKPRFLDKKARNEMHKTRQQSHCVATSLRRRKLKIFRILTKRRQ